MCRRCRTSSWPSTSTSLGYIAQASSLLERSDDALEYARRGMRLAQTTGQSPYIPGQLVLETNALFMKGRIAEAVAVAETATDAAVLTGNDQFAVWALWADAMACSVGGRHRPGAGQRARGGGARRADGRDLLLEPVAAASGGRAERGGRRRRRAGRAGRVRGRPRSAAARPPRRPGLGAPDPDPAVAGGLARRRPSRRGRRRRVPGRHRCPSGRPPRCARGRPCCSPATIRRGRPEPRARRSRWPSAAGNPAARPRGLGRCSAPRWAPRRARAGDRESSNAPSGRCSSAGAMREADAAAQELRRLGWRGPRRRARRRRRHAIGRAERHGSWEVATLVAAGKRNREVAAAAVPEREDRRDPPGADLRQARRALPSGAGHDPGRRRLRAGGDSRSKARATY